MSYIFICEVKGLVNGKTVCSYALPADKQDRQLASMAFLKLMITRLNEGHQDAIDLATCLFTITENLKFLYPEFDSQVRASRIEWLKKKKNEKR